MAHPSIDPTFYRTAAEAAAAPGEQLAYVVAFDRAGQQHDAMTVIDVNAASDSYGRVVGWTDVPGPRRRASSLRLERLQQRPEARGPRHARPRAPISPGSRAAIVQHPRVRHPAGPTQPDADQDDRRQEPVGKRPDTRVRTRCTADQTAYS